MASFSVSSDCQRAMIIILCCFKIVGWAMKEKKRWMTNKSLDKLLMIGHGGMNGYSLTDYPTRFSHVATLAAR